MNIMKVISITNQKGGVGKTTSAINIAYFIAKRGFRTLLVDFDPQGNATSGLGIDKNNLDFTIILLFFLYFFRNFYKIPHSN